MAREPIAHGLDDAATSTWLRRLYADPGGDVIALTSRQRFFCDGLADYLRLRDQGLCRTPWCDAPIADADHIIPAADHGPTEHENGQGLCRACNHAKQAPDWAQQPVRTVESRHRVVTATPTGHTYHSTAPPPPEPSRTRPTAIDLAIDRLCEQLLDRPRVV